jgi:hypothetical protein
MFERRRTVRSLSTLACARGNTVSIRIPLHPAPILRRLWRVFFRMLVSIGIGAGFGYRPLQNDLAWAGALGLVILCLRWNRVVSDSSVPPRFFSFYPASAERIWTSRFGLFRLSSLWYAADALAIISWLAIGRRISLSSAFASIPSALALAAWITALPLLLAFTLKPIKPGHILFPIFLMGFLSLASIKEAPGLFAVLTP